MKIFAYIHTYIYPCTHTRTHTHRYLISLFTVEFIYLYFYIPIYMYRSQVTEKSTSGQKLTNIKLLVISVMMVRVGMAGRGI